MIVTPISTARVMACNTSTMGAESHCEIQIPRSTWTDEEVMFEVNLGNFSEEDVTHGLFVFVINPNGEVSEAFPLNS